MKDPRASSEVHLRVDPFEPCARHRIEVRCFREAELLVSEGSLFRVLWFRGLGCRGWC